MSTQVASLFATLSLDDTSFIRSLGSAEAGLFGLGGGITRIGDSITQMGVGLQNAISPFVNFGLEGIGVAANFQESMAEIGARTGLVGEEMQAVADFAQQMGAESVFSAQEAAAGLLDLLSSGSSVAEAMELLPIVMDAATASGADLGQTADTVTDLLATFGLSAADAESVVDSLAGAAASSSADMVALAQGFGNVGATANQFGWTVDETAAALALLNESGVKGAKAGDALKSMLLGLTDTTASTQGAWAELGMEIFDSEGNMRNVNDFLPELGARLSALPMEDQIRLSKDLAGSFGITALNILTTGTSIGEMQTTMEGQASAAEIADARMGTFNTTMDSLGGSIEALQTAVFLPFIEQVLTPLAEKGINVVNMLIAWAQQNPETVSTVVRVIAVVAVLAAGMTALGIGIAGVGTVFGLMFSPMVLVIGAGVALGVLLSTLITDTDDLTLVIGLLTPVVVMLAAAWMGVSFPMVLVIGLGTALGLAFFALNEITGDWRLTLTILLPLVTALAVAMGVVSWPVLAVVAAVSALAAGFILLKGNWEQVVNFIETSVVWAFENAKNIMDQALEPLRLFIEFIDSIDFGLFDKIADAAGFVGGLVGDAGNFLGLAEGGDVQAGQRIRVGERGPEEFISMAPGRVISNEDSERGSGVQIGSVTIHANDEAGGRAAARGFAAEMQVLVRQMG